MRTKALKRGKALEVMVRVAILLGKHRKAAECVTDLQLVAHSHAAMKLHCLLAHETRIVGELDFGGRDCTRAIGAIFGGIHLRASEASHGARLLVCNVKIDDAVLQGLE